MLKKSIPTEIREEVLRVVDLFNKTDLAGRGMVYFVRFWGRYVYIDRDDGDGADPICRLSFTGDINAWDFAIYKYSSERYDPDEWFFPGAEEVDGSIQGALRACIQAYE